MCIKAGKDPHQLSTVVIFVWGEVGEGRGYKGSFTLNFSNFSFFNNGCRKFQRIIGVLLSLCDRFLFCNKDTF